MRCRSYCPYQYIFFEHVQRTEEWHLGLKAIQNSCCCYYDNWRLWMKKDSSWSPLAFTQCSLLTCRHTMLCILIFNMVREGVLQYSYIGPLAAYSNKILNVSHTWCNAHNTLIFNHIPRLLIAYIYDLPGRVRSRVRLFADDTIIYITIKPHTSVQSIKEDLHNLELWKREWSVEFNADKCEVLTIHRKKKPVIFPWKLHDTTLRTTENAKYIGVTISSNLNWSSHINPITDNVKNSLKSIRRNVKIQNKQL